MDIAELHVLANDLDVQRDFYASVLSLPVFEDANSLTVKAGSSRLIFNQAPTHWNGSYHFAFNIPSNRAEQARAWVSERVPLIKSNSGEDYFTFEHWNAHSFYFWDAAGNILEFIARHNLTNDSEEIFIARIIL